MCIVSESTLSDNTSHDFSGHYENHQVEIEEKHKLVPGLSYGRSMWSRKTEVIQEAESLC